MNRSPLRLGIMISGRGSNMQAIVRNIEAGELAAEVTLDFCLFPLPELAFPLRHLPRRSADRTLAASSFRVVRPSKGQASVEEPTTRHPEA